MINLGDLTTVEIIRTRPSMYVGGVDEFGLHHMVGEVISNSIDQCLMGEATHLRVPVNDGVVQVSDDGVGLPFDRPSLHSADTLATEFLTEHHTTGSTDGHAPHVHLHRRHGVGVVAANALSEWFEVKSWRNGQLWEQKFRRGAATSPAKVSQTGSARGTVIRFKPDSNIFNQVAVSPDAFRDEAVHAVHLFPGLQYYLNEEFLHAPGGLGDLLRTKSIESRDDYGAPPAVDCFEFDGMVDDTHVIAAAFGSSSGTPEWTTWVNGQITQEGGSHQNGFSDALRNCGWMPAVILLHVIMHDPQFAGPTRGKLDVPAIRNAVSQGLSSPLVEYCDRHQVK